MANNRIAYGLAKKYGIDTKGMTPRQVWNALNKKGISVHGEAEATARQKEIDELNSLTTEELKKRAKFPLDYFGQKGHKKPDTTKEIPEPPKEAFGFRNDRLYIPDHIRHTEEMGYKDPKKYELAAINFWKNGNGKLYHSEVTKCFYRYNPKTLEFLVVEYDGYIKTFFHLPLKKFERKRYQNKFYEL